MRRGPGPTHLLTTVPLEEGALDPPEDSLLRAEGLAMSQPSPQLSHGGRADILCEEVAVGAAPTLPLSVKP